MHRVTLIPGDGTGPEIAEVARRCIEATGVHIRWDICEAGLEAAEKEGTPLPKSTLDSIRKNKVVLKGPVTTPVGSGYRSVNVALRQELDLYACVRPCKTYAGVRTRYQNVDLVIVRENTEDLYAGIEFEKDSAEAGRLFALIGELSPKRVRPGSAISIKPISEAASERIVRFAFEYARANRRKKVTAVHKANIMKFTDGLFLEVAREVAEGFPDIEFEDRIVDNMCMQLVQKPERYDVLVLPNLYGDIVSDLAAGLVGGLGVSPGANFGDHMAIFEATHGSSPKYKGLNKMNPTALILSGVMMLRHLREGEAASRLERATSEVIRRGEDVTYDLKAAPDDPTAKGTKEMGEAIVREIGKQ